MLAVTTGLSGVPGFALVCLLIILLTRSFDAAGVLFVILAGFGPVVWRLLV
jgi:hypothetical protein